MLRRVACILCTLICALLVAGAPYVSANLPVPPEGLAALPYEGWAGVVRLRVYQGFRSGTGSIVPWLNACLSSYEKRNPGVYVQVETVSATALGRFASDAPRPDMIIFTPGALSNSSGLIECEAPQGLLPGLNQACKWQDRQFAVPLCYGGYGMLVNTADIAELPDDWAKAAREQYRARTRSKSAHYALQIPGEGSWPQVARGLLDELPAASENLPADYLQCSMIKAWSDFRRGVVACIPASQWHLRQLALLESEGKAPEYKFYPSSGGYTDQYFAAAVVDSGMADSQARARICQEVIAHLAGEESQARLDLALLMPARAGMRMYTSGGGMTALETAYLASAEFASLFAG